MTYTSERIMKALRKSKDSSWLVLVREGEDAWSPSSDRTLQGPLILRYRKLPDGTVDVIVNTLD